MKTPAIACLIVAAALFVPGCAPSYPDITIASEEMAVEAALTGDRELAYHAIAYDPLTASVLSLAETRKMVDAMFRKNKAHLPQFKIS